MKKSLVGVVVITLVLSLVGSFASAATFRDVPESNRFYEEIDLLSNLEIISGFTDGTFRPEENVTRAQAAILIGKTFDLDGTKRTTSFSDVHLSNTASGYIESAVEEGILSGFPDGTYRPNQTVTRAQLAIILGRAFDITEAVDIHFPDVSKTSAAYPYIENVVAAGIAYGYEDGYYRPNRAVTREQFAAFLARAYVYTPEAPEEAALSSFFLKNGQTASFRGEGNEYATYTTRTVWHNNKHVTVYEDNGGTVVARTFRIEDDRIVVVREEAESYEDYTPTVSELQALEPLYTYLQLPLENGASFDGWTVIDDSAVLSTPLRTFNHVIVIEKMNEHGDVSRKYFVKGYGEVKDEYEMAADGETIVITSEIEQIE